MFVIQGMAKCNICRAEIGIDVEFSLAHVRKFKYGTYPASNGITCVGSIKNICDECVLKVNRAFAEILGNSIYATDEEKNELGVWI